MRAGGVCSSELLLLLLLLLHWRDQRRLLAGKTTAVFRWQRKVMACRGEREI